MAGQLQRNAEHFSTALAADKAVLRNAERKDMRKRVQLHDHQGRSLGTACSTLASLLVAVAFLVMFFSYGSHEQFDCEAVVSLSFIH